MGQLVAESPTTSIPGSVVGFALAATYAELESRFPIAPLSYNAHADLTVQIDALSQRDEELLWESHVYGWPWVIADIGYAEGVITAWASSSSLVGIVNHFSASAVYSCHSQTYTAVVATDAWQSPPLRMFLGYTPETRYLIGLCPKLKIDKKVETQIRRTGMARAVEWCDAWIKKETTRRVSDHTVETVALQEQRQACAKPTASVANSLAAKESWYADAILAVDKLSSLPSNWNGYGAQAPNQTALTQARSVLDELNNINLKPSRILSSAAGGVSLCFFMPKKYGEMECYNTGEIVAIIKNTADNSRTIWEVDSIPEAVKRIQGFLGSQTGR